jgi:hypothetical protein
VKMATEVHRRGREGDHQWKSKGEMDKEIKEIREKMERLTMRMQQESQVHWRYDWPMKKIEKWPI